MPLDRTTWGINSKVKGVTTVEQKYLMDRRPCLYLPAVGQMILAHERIPSSGDIRTPIG